MNRYGVVVIICLVMAFVGSNVSALTYYVNDTSTNGDVYCDAKGDDLNDGRTKTTPMQTITNLIAQRDLEPGDIVYVDTGIYSNYTVFVSSEDSGSASNLVSFVGSTNLSYGGSIIRPGASSTGISLSSATNVLFEYFTLEFCKNAVSLNNNSDRNVFRYLFIHSVSVGFGSWSLNSGLNCIFENLLIDSATQGVQDDSWGIGAFDRVYLRNCQKAFNVGRTFFVSNSVIEGGTAFPRAYPKKGDNNIFWDTDLGYDCLSALQKERNIMWNSIFCEPKYVADANGYFFPSSTEGRYDSGSTMWVKDRTMSPVVDAGASMLSVGSEPLPNGSVINVGTWGGGDWASKGYTNAWLRALTYNDGGRVDGISNRIYWVGGNVDALATVSLEYSVKQGQDWALITGAGAVPYTNNYYTWDVSIGYPVTSALWRVMLNSDSNVWDATDQRFSLNGGQVYYYINDDDTTDDLYCSAIGSDMNLGTQSDSPVRTFTNLLARYSLHGNVTVFVDTGIYNNEKWSISGDDDGADTHLVVWQGNTNILAGKTLINRTGGYGVEMSAADYTSFQYLDFMAV